MRLGGPESLDFFQSVQKANYHFADVNSARNFIINPAENMFNNTRQAILFANKQTFFRFSLQILVINSCFRFLLQILALDSCFRFLLFILALDSHFRFSLQILALDSLTLDSLTLDSLTLYSLTLDSHFRFPLPSPPFFPWVWGG